jgi:hypothetical protein
MRKITNKKITNKFNLPKPVLDVLLEDDYDRGECDYTVTELLSPPQQRLLRKKFQDQIIEDASDLIYRFEGKILHAYLQKANREGLVEKRFYAEIAGRVISAQIDHLAWDDEAPHTLSDYKRCPAFKLNKVEPDWEFQLNVQAYLLRENGLKVDALQICAFGKDHSKVEAWAKPSYPQAPVAKIPIPFWEPQRVVDAVTLRIQEHEKRPVPECTDDERFKRHNRTMGGIYPLKCMFYCDVASFCPQYKKEQANGSEGTKGSA